eukprot:4080593-Prymnesium_polylepis.1
MFSISVHRSLWRNNIGDQGATSDCRGVKGQRRADQFAAQLSFNQICSSGATAIADALKFNGAKRRADRIK